MTVRALTAADEAAFIRLIRAAYGETYAHGRLYQPGELGRALAAGWFTGFVDAAPSGELFGHTAVLHKDPTGDFLESGLSLRNLRLTEPGATSMQACWEFLLDWARPRAHWLHQHTTTLHVFAQRHALPHMAARPVGFVLDYTVGEQLAQVRHAPGPMHAVCMSTELQPGRRAEVSLPEGRWFAWLAERFGSLGYPLRAVSGEGRPVSVQDVERIEGLDLVRRTVAAGGAPLTPAGRVDLVEVPADERIAALPTLDAAGWLPVAVRPRTLAPPTVICQRITGDPRRLLDARLVGDEAQSARARWLEIVA